MPKVEFKRVETDEEVENINIKDGQLIYSKTGKTFMDYGDERIPTGSGGSSVEVDTEMSDTSENAVQNKVIKEYVDSQTVPEEVIISDTQPTTDDWKLWINTGEVGSQASEITNEYSTSTGLGYSANYVNNLHTYSTNEIRIGTWIDGKPIYRKVINFGSLPNNTTKNVAHNITNLEEVINISGCVKSGSNYYPIPLQYKGSDSNYNVECLVNTSSISMVSNTDRSSYSAYITIEYTKTTD